MQNVNPPTKTKRYTYMGNMGYVYGGSVDGGGYRIPRPDKPETHRGKGRRNSAMYGRENESGSSLQGGDHTVIPGGPGLPGGHDTPDTNAKTENPKFEMKYLIENIPFAIVLATLLFLIVTTRLPNIRTQSQQAECCADYATPGDVRRAIDSGRNEMQAASKEIDAEIRKIRLVSPLDGRPE